jgi:alpha-D-ribose 1-methylphosphonate 5-triphosphate synthase subunit PhnG
MFTQSQALTLLTHAPAQEVKMLAEDLIPLLGEITVLVNRTGLVMLPYTDSANGTRFHLGEVLVCESRVRIGNGTEGYAVCMGRDLEQSLAIALLDAAWQAHIERETLSFFLKTQDDIQRAADQQLLSQVAKTKIELETF